MKPFEFDVPHFWAKSDASGKPHSLIAHLLDAAAVAELIWDEYMSAAFKAQVNAAGKGRGRDLFVLLVAWHDLGKATPVFQLKAPAGMEHLLGPIQRASLPLPASARGKRWPHGSASALIVRRALAAFEVEGADWTIPLVQGHHGTYLSSPRRPGLEVVVAHGEDPWPQIQLSLALAIARRIGVDPQGWKLHTPSRGIQLALGGFLVMADWIASSSEFPGLGLVDLSMPEARERARAAWDSLSLVGGWDTRRLLQDVRQFEDRFGFHPRPVQTMTIEAALKLPEPGMLVVEAPMGEGKTEAALAAAEVLASRFGLNGVIFAMPTQGTTDAMYTRVMDWIESVDNLVPISLLHGKSMLNEEWVEHLEGVRVTEIYEDEFGLSDGFGAPETSNQRGAVPPRWLLGRHRGLLSPVAVGTIDQVLWAATRTKYVALRHAGLSGRVLIIDEVHSYDAYMSVFLDELLRWCGRMRTPVVLMSATLAPSVRERLVRCWRRGAGLDELEGGINVDGYPSVVAANGLGTVEVTTTKPRRPDLPVHVEVLASDSYTETGDIAEAILAEISTGGCALVIMNTVARAQEVWRGVKDSGIQTLLIHGQFTASERAQRTALALDLLGPHGQRPTQFIVVATQIAEQSFDVDADILFTDLAPIDLMLQRIGRLHRHEHIQRPSALAEPMVRITGLEPNGWSWPPAFEHVYQRWTLMRAANEVRSPVTWQIPSQIPELVSRTYESEWLGPQELEHAELEAREIADREQNDRENYAYTWRLDAEPEEEPVDLTGLHRGSGIASEDRRPVVRDGEESLEVSLIRLTEGCYTTLGGRSLGPDGMRAASSDLAREVLADSVRLRWRDDLAGITPFPAWAGLHLLGNMPVVVLDDAGRGRAGEREIRYDVEEGLISR